MGLPAPGSKVEALAILALLDAGEPLSPVAAQYGMTPQECRELPEQHGLEV